MASVEVVLHVNGSEQRLTLVTSTTLLDALREHLGLTSSKKGCDHGQCGACTVLMQVEGATGARSIPLVDFHRLPADEPQRDTVLEPGELITAVELPPLGWGDDGPRRVGDPLVGFGVAASTYPARRRPAEALARAEADGTFELRLMAADIGTGARTALTQIAADALDAPVERVRVLLGDSSYPPAPLAGGLEVHVDTTEEIEGQGREPLARHGFGAQFVEVRVDADTGEVRVPRALGIVGTAAAVANAVFDATGIRIRRLPITPDKLVTQLG